MFKLLFCTCLLLIATLAQDYRLPDYVEPHIYQLTFDIDPEKDNFTGTTTIAFISSKNTSEIFLHASPQYITINTVSANQQPCLVVDSNNETEIIRILCPLNFTKGIKSSITIHYQGIYSEDYCGIFKNYYKEHGKVQTIVATQMQATCARRVFPCFDEPQYKARFVISIFHPAFYDARGNQVRNRRINVTNNMKVESFFGSTPSMSTYLVGFVVSRLYIFKANGTNVQSSKMKGSIGTALEYGPRLLRLMGNYTGKKYDSFGINKITHIALPTFPVEAMENWGICTYDEIFILDEGNDTTVEHKQMIVQMMAHEIVHQWFGNLVTMDWWSNLWLNEGFARYFEYHITNALKNLDLDLERQFVLKNNHPTLLLDSFPSNPLSNQYEEIETADAIESKFDEITYGKGAAVIRMIRGIMGKENFQKGLHFYLDTNKFHISNPNILFESLQAADQSNSHPLYVTMHSFIYKNGYPLVTIRLNETNRVQLTQEEFYIIKKENKDTSLWYVPISYTTSTEKSFEGNSRYYWLEPENPSYLYVEEEAWIIVNLQQIGYYRVNYDATLWDRLINALKEPDMSSIDVLNRASLVDDIFNIARAGKVSYRKAFQLAEYLKNETEYYPWVAYFKNFNFIMGHLTDDETVELLRDVTLHWLKQAFPERSIEEDGVPMSTLKHAEMLNNKCFLGDLDCIEYALKSYDNFKETSSLENYNERLVIFCIAISLSSKQEDEFDYLLDLYQNTDSAYVRRNILRSLSCASSELKRYWSDILHENSLILPQDVYAAVDAIIESGPTGINLVLNSLKDNITYINTRFTGLLTLPYFIEKIATKISDIKQLDELNDIIVLHKHLIGAEDCKEALKVAETNLKWINTHNKEIKMVLKTLQTNSSSSTRILYHIIIINLLSLLLVKLL